MNTNPFALLPTKSLLGRMLPMAALLGCVELCSCDSLSGTNLDMGPVGDMTVVTHFGLIRLASTNSMLGAQSALSSSAAAVFVDTTQSGTSCSHQVIGACALYACTGASIVLPTAGNISISGTAEPTAPMLNPNSDGSYKSTVDNSNRVSFPAGQTFNLNAAGTQAIPAFQASISAPGASFMLTNPDGTNTLDPIMVSLPKHQDFQVSWNALAAGSRVHVELNQNITTSSGSFLECDYDGATGMGVIPAALLGQFRTTSTNGQIDRGVMLVGPASSTVVAAGAYATTIIAMSSGRRATVSINEN